MNGQVLKRALLIAGPTASGKSDLAIRLAQERNGVVINADAMQVYRELRILTARPSFDDERLVPHRMYGHVSGQEEYSVARWLAEIEAELTSAWEGGLLPVIVGGTGLYFKALQQGLADVPPIPAHIREKWRSYKGDLAHELASRDPISAASLNPGDRQRLARALEVIESTGKPLRYWQRQSERRAPLTGVVTERVFLDVPRQILYERAEHRFDRMIAAGAIDEVRPLIGLSPDLPMMRAIGLPELRDYLMGKQALSAAIEAAKAATRQYIKRQFTWWRGQMTGWSVAGSNNELLHAREDR